MTVALFRMGLLEICQRIVAVLKQGFFSRRLKLVERIAGRKPACQLESGTPAVRQALVDYREGGFMQIIRKGRTPVGHFRVKKLSSFIVSVVNAN